MRTPALLELSDSVLVPVSIVAALAQRQPSRPLVFIARTSSWPPRRRERAEKYLNASGSSYGT